MKEEKTSKKKKKQKKEKKILKFCIESQSYTEALYCIFLLLHSVILYLNSTESLFGLCKTNILSKMPFCTNVSNSTLDQSPDKEYSANSSAHKEEKDFYSANFILKKVLVHDYRH